MGKIPTTENIAAETLDTAMADANIAGDALIESAAVAAEPWLGLPIISSLFNGAVSWITGFFSKGLQLLGTYWIIEFQDADEMNGAQATLQQLQKDALAKASAGIITADEQAWLNAVSSFIHSNGSAKPK